MGFSADWLALRDPADRAARDAGLLLRAAQAAGSEPVILDLGCGTGASWTALAPYLPRHTRWVLVDHDPALLAIARERIGPAAQVVRAELTDLEALPWAVATLVTASALLDLVSEGWVNAVVARLNVPFYAALSYDGQMSWSPPDPRDAAITEAFNTDQRRDKGFGPALGPEAAAFAAGQLRAKGFAVDLAPSPWVLGPDMAALQRDLTQGIAQAAALAGADGAADWALTRRGASATTTCRIGHLDLLAIPQALIEEKA